MAGIGQPVAPCIAVRTKALALQFDLSIKHFLGDNRAQLFATQPNRIFLLSHYSFAGASAGILAAARFGIGRFKRFAG
jgi:hypothetical protein